MSSALSSTVYSFVFQHGTPKVLDGREGTAETRLRRDIRSDDILPLSSHIYSSEASYLGELGGERPAQRYLQSSKSLHGFYLLLIP